jgi:hypothetical protein
MMNGLDVFLAFATLWVVIIAGLIYLSRRLTTPRQPRAACCLEVPCSKKCAERHQELRDHEGVEWSRVVHELGAIVTAGQHELEDTGPGPGGPGGWPAAS